MTTTSTPTFRKTRQGEWVAFGPAGLLRQGAVDIAKRDGTTTRRIITRVGRTFQVDGVECAYGYLAVPAVGYGHARHTAECYECGHRGPVGTRCQECFEGSHTL